jgi:stearoyl-CoA desaturase (delta-9 desaturase)
MQKNSWNEKKFTHREISWTSSLWILLMHIGAFFALYNFSKTNLIVAFVLYFITGCLGITLTYHRLLSHRSFAVPKWIERILTTCAALAMQGGPIKWCAQHRMHHSNPDTPLDPHNSRRGFFYCHMGWLLKYEDEFDNPEKLRKFARDINADPYYRWLETVTGQFLPQFVLAAALFAIGGIGMVLWAVCFRMVWLYHCTWLVNSATHFFGYKNYVNSDHSRNTWWVALLTFGEGWHNNHHAYQHVAEAGHKWWEFDVTMMVIRLLDLFGFVTRINSIRAIKPENRKLPLKIRVEAA